MEQSVAVNTVNLDEITSALVDVLLVPDEKERSLSDIARCIDGAMQTSLSFRSLIMQLTADTDAPGAEQLMELVDASSGFAKAQVKMMDALIQANLHLESEGLSHVLTHE